MRSPSQMVYAFCDRWLFTVQRLNVSSPIAEHIEKVELGLFCVVLDFLYSPLLLPVPFHKADFACHITPHIETFCIYR